MQLDDTAIRTQLHADILAAWATNEIHDDLPYQAASYAELPRGFVELKDIEIRRAGPGASVNDVSIPHDYIITGQFAWPVSGTIEISKVARANELLSRLTSAKRYTGWMRDITAVEFGQGQADMNEPTYEVTVTLRLHVISDA